MRWDGLDIGNREDHGEGSSRKGRREKERLIERRKKESSRSEREREKERGKWREMKTLREVSNIIVF